jgi:uncharacterized membrane protein YccF (DUF307 family)
VPGTWQWTPAMRIGCFALWPLGRTVVPIDDVNAAFIA